MRALVSQVFGHLLRTSGTLSLFLAFSDNEKKGNLFKSFLCFHPMTLLNLCTLVKT